MENNKYLSPERYQVIDYLNELHAVGLLEKLHAAGILVAEVVRDRNIANWVRDKRAATKCSRYKAHTLAAPVFSLTSCSIDRVCKNLLTDTEPLPMAAPAYTNGIDLINQLNANGTLQKLYRCRVVNSSVFTYRDIYNWMLERTKTGITMYKAKFEAVKELKISLSTAELARYKFETLL